jgi:hypothetical protein
MSGTHPVPLKGHPMGDQGEVTFPFDFTEVEKRAKKQVESAQKADIHLMQLQGIVKKMQQRQMSSLIEAAGKRIPGMGPTPQDWSPGSGGALSYNPALKQARDEKTDQALQKIAQAQMQQYQGKEGGLGGLITEANMLKLSLAGLTAAVTFAQGGINRLVDQGSKGGKELGDINLQASRAQRYLGLDRSAVKMALESTPDAKGLSNLLGYMENQSMTSGRRYTKDQINNAVIAIQKGEDPAIVMNMVAQNNWTRLAGIAKGGYRDKEVGIRSGERMMDVEAWRSAGGDDQRGVNARKLESGRAVWNARNPFKAWFQDHMPGGDLGRDAAVFGGEYNEFGVPVPRRGVGPGRPGERIQQDTPQLPIGVGTGGRGTSANTNNEAARIIGDRIANPRPPVNVGTY